MKKVFIVLFLNILGITYTIAAEKTSGYGFGNPTENATRTPDELKKYLIMLLKRDQNAAKHFNPKIPFETTRGIYIEHFARIAPNETDPEKYINSLVLVVLPATWATDYLNSMYDPTAGKLVWYHEKSTPKGYGLADPNTGEIIIKLSCINPTRFDRKDVPVVPAPDVVDEIAVPVDVTIKNVTPPLPESAKGQPVIHTETHIHIEGVNTNTNTVGGGTGGGYAQPYPTNYPPQKEKKGGSFLTHAGAFVLGVGGGYLLNEVLDKDETRTIYQDRTIYEDREKIVYRDRPTIPQFPRRGPIQPPSGYPGNSPVYVPGTDPRTGIPDPIPSGSGTNNGFPAWPSSFTSQNTGYSTTTPNSGSQKTTTINSRVGTATLTIGGQEVPIR